MSFDLKYIVENKCLHKYASLSTSIVNRCNYGPCGREPRATVAGCLVLTTEALNSFKGVSFLLARAISWRKTAKLQAHLSKCHTPVSPLYSRYYNHFTHISCTLFHLLWHGWPQLVGPQDASVMYLDLSPVINSNDLSLVLFKWGKCSCK